VRKVVISSCPLQHQLEGALDVAKTRRISPGRDSWQTWLVIAGKPTTGQR
jgi:hypothetical protein